MLHITAPQHGAPAAVADGKTLQEIASYGVASCVTPTSNSFLTRFELGPLLGRGSFSDVRACRCRATGTEVACKIITKGPHLDTGNPKKLCRLRDEMRVLAAMRHPNITPLLAVYETPSELLLVLERAHGGELFDRIVEAGSFSERQAATVASGMLAALVHLHAHGVMHRDVKPENLLLTSPDSWEVKLTDFGLVRVLTDSDGLGVEPGLVAPHTVCGSSFYVAPEIVQQQPGYNCGVDVWSAGVVLYIMLCGQPPFAQCPALPGWRVEFDQQWATVSTGAKDLIQQLLTWDPTQRISADAALQHAWLSPDFHSSPHAQEAQLSPAWPSSMRRFNAKRKRAAAAVATPRSVWDSADAFATINGATAEASDEGIPSCARESASPVRKLRHIVTPSPTSSPTLSCFSASSLSWPTTSEQKLDVDLEIEDPTADILSPPDLEASIRDRVEAWSALPMSLVTPKMLLISGNATLIAGEVDEAIPMLESPPAAHVVDCPLPSPPGGMHAPTSMRHVPASFTPEAALPPLPDDQPPLLARLGRGLPSRDAPEYDTLSSDESGDEGGCSLTPAWT